MKLIIRLPFANYKFPHKLWSKQTSRVLLASDYKLT